MAGLCEKATAGEDLDIETFLERAFESNFERLSADTGQSLTPHVKAAAFRQVSLYWRRLRELAESVTETEVRLTLPEQLTPDGRRFTLEGIVDIVRDAERTTMYDVKTYLDADDLRHDAAGPHVRQLNLYAHIWQSLRGQPLDEVAVVATRPPPALESAMASMDEARIESALRRWDPIVAVELSEADVAETVADFACVVDRIERAEFRPPDVGVLLGPSRPGSPRRFGNDVCGQCDARFSCASFRQFAARSRPTAAARAFQDTLHDFGSDETQERRRDATMRTAQTTGDTP